MTDDISKRIEATNAPANAGRTPGPWCLEYDGSLCMAGQIVVMGLIGPDASTVAERRANNNLIAAAPDLLEENKRLREALEEILKVVPRIDAIPREEYDPHGDYTELLKINRIAFAALN